MIGALAATDLRDRTRRPVAAVSLADADHALAATLSGRPAIMTPVGTAATPGRPLLRLARAELRILLSRVRWPWYAGAVSLWTATVLAPDDDTRGLVHALCALWPVLVWAELGGREAIHRTEQVVFAGPRPLLPPLAASWSAGVTLTAAVTSGVIVGRALAGEPLAAIPWILSVLFVPSLALALGALSLGTVAFQVVYPVLWYLGPFNPEDGLAAIDFLGIHEGALCHTSPGAALAVVAALIATATSARRRRVRR